MSLVDIRWSNLAVLDLLMIQCDQEKVSNMIRKYHNHTLQTKKNEPQNIKSHKKSGRQLK